MVLLSSPGLLAISASPARAGAGDFAVLLAANRTVGVAPMLTSFQAAVTSGTPTAYSWAFGDGATFTGSPPAAADPTHLFARPGVYVVLVNVSEGAAYNTSSITIDATAGALVAVAQASIASGSAPLTVEFTARISGGSGTYLGVTWAFGDGGVGSGVSLAYTYQHSGNFQAQVEVQDSVGTTVNSSVWVNVTAAVDASSDVNGEVLVAAPWLVGGFAGGLIAAWLVVRWRGRSPMPTRTAPSVGAAPLAGPEGAGPPLQPPEAPTSRVEPPSGPSEPRAAGGPDAPLLTQRLLLHLARQGRLTPNEVATVGFTQGGMAEALGVPQNSLTNTLRRMIAAGALTVETRHVTGKSRRLKVYLLTARGETLATELRLRPQERPR